uniref:Uncharacterized protein n=1 Tax=Ditylum brightwellii TaxID=49249 RepID=A0A7S4RHE0_9STRA
MHGRFYAFHRDVTAGELPHSVEVEPAWLQGQEKQLPALDDFHIAASTALAGTEIDTIDTTGMMLESALVAKAVLLPIGLAAPLLMAQMSAVEAWPVLRNRANTMHLTDQLPHLWDFLRAVGTNGLENLLVDPAIVVDGTAAFVRQRKALLSDILPQHQTHAALRQCATPIRIPSSSNPPTVPTPGSIVDLESAISTSQPDDKQQNSELFSDSTHIFIYTDTFKHSDGTYHPVGFIHRLYAYMIIFFQYLLYFSVALLGTLDSQYDLVPVETNNCLQTGKIKLESLTCPTFENVGVERVIPTFIAVFTLTFYILPDVMGSMILMKTPDKSAKIAAALLLIGAMIATLSGAIFVFYGMRGSAVEVFLGCVGIVFIHDLDEKLRSALNRVSNPLMIFLLMIVWVPVFVTISFAIGQDWFGLEPQAIRISTDDDLFENEPL